jgi:hypothetical protein
VTNIGAVSDTFQLAVVPAGSSAPVPQLSQASLQLDPGASAVVPVVFQADGLAPGAYEGYITIQGSLAGASSRVPYWYGVPSGVPAHITVLKNDPVRAGASVNGAVYFRVTDAIGIPVTGAKISVTATSAGSTVGSIASVDSSVPGAFTFGGRISIQPGNNTFQIQAGPVTATVTIVGQ